MGTPSGKVLISWVWLALGSGGWCTWGLDGLGGMGGEGFIQDMAGRLHMVGGSVYRKWT